MMRMMSSSGRKRDGRVDLDTGRVVFVFLEHMNTVLVESMSASLMLVETVVALEKFEIKQLDTLCHGKVRRVPWLPNW